ncbi:Auxin response factor 17 [Apostasia shenzhenica]|uniref:Auxin response factor n=1 Tax=Apostasia shenzhenica TaxID=1088818 RepID=A0A2I0A824_9ASPA|nr:Auxin response factor 17 [Apostasia shenzhenica]
MASSRSGRPMDYSVWKACAGGSARVPPVGAAVYYFPEGHAEHAASAPKFSTLRRHPFFHCRVTAVSLLAHHESEEVFARISLDPRASNAAADPALSPTPLDDEGGSGVVHFAKVLTPSDANNGGGFSVPRFCADSIFPKLDYKADPPVQNILVLDVHGSTWEFRHIYRGTPRRHLLTTGWSKFINSKKLVAGDSVVFIRNHAGQLFVGVRRTCRTYGDGPIDLQFSPEIKLKHAGVQRIMKERLPPESVAEAVRAAEMGRPFEVIYYPRVGWPEFVVAKERVEAAMAVPWGSGMRIKMAVETDESPRTTWFHGTVSSDAVPWARSLWRTLTVNWDEPEVLHNLKTVSPWQVEVVQASSAYPVLKRPKLSEEFEISKEEHGSFIFPLTGFCSTEMGSLTSSVFDLNGSPSGRQGARHFLDFAPSSTGEVFANIANMNGILKSRNLVISKSEALSPAACSPPRKSRNGSIQLFGQIIQIEQLADSNVSTEFSLWFPHNQLLDNQIRLSAVGACE